MVQRAEIIREKGTDRSRFLRGEVDRYAWVDVGSSYLPGELVASYLSAQLEMEPVIRQRRLSLFDHYMQALAPLAERGLVGLPVIPDDCTGNGHMFYLMMRVAGQRDAFIAFMKPRGIIALFHYVPLHSAPGGVRFGRSVGLWRRTRWDSLPLVASLFACGLGYGATMLTTGGNLQHKLMPLLTIAAVFLAKALTEGRGDAGRNDTNRSLIRAVPVVIAFCPSHSTTPTHPW